MRPQYGVGPCGVLIITTPSEIFWEKIVSFYSALVIVWGVAPRRILIFLAFRKGGKVHVVFYSGIITVSTSTIVIIVADPLFAGV